MNPKISKHGHRLNNMLWQPEKIFILHVAVHCVLKYSDSDSEVEFPAALNPVPSAVPVTGESYCSCDSQIEASRNPRLRGFTHIHDCHCGEDDQGEPLHLCQHRKKIH